MYREIINRQIEGSLKKIDNYLKEMDKYPDKMGVYLKEIHKQLEYVRKNYKLLNNIIQISKGEYENMSNGFQPQQSGPTSLRVTKTATGFRETVREYDWNIQKTANPTEIDLPMGQTENASFTLTITRSSTDTSRVGVRGVITVENTGENPTVGLSVGDIVQFRLPGSGPNFAAVPDQRVVSITPIPPTPSDELPAGATGRYAYEVEFTPPANNAVYRNEARVTIQNHPDGVRTFVFRQDFTLPTTPTLIEIDETAVLSDVVSFPSGITGTQPTDQVFNAPPTEPIIINIPITNESAACGQNLTLSNQATLTETDTGTTRVSTADVTINTGDCPPSICPLSRGFWMTHYPTDWPQTVLDFGLKIGNVLYSASQLQNTLNRPPRGDASIILAHQLIAAKLNIANGADPSPVLEIIANADALLQAASPCQTNLMPSCQVPYNISPSSSAGAKMVAAASILDAYNRGQMTPGCAI